MDTAIQPMRPYNPGKLNDPSKQFLYVVPADRRRTIITVTEKSDPVLHRVAKQAAEIDEGLSGDAVAVDMLIGGGPACILAILPVGTTRSTRTWDHEVHFTRRVLHAAGMDDASVYPTPRYIAPILASANPWFGNWGEAEGCRSQAAMMTQAEFYHRQGWDTVILDHEARWSVNGWGLQQVTPDDIAQLREDDELWTTRSRHAATPSAAASAAASGTSTTRCPLTAPCRRPRSASSTPSWWDRRPRIPTHPWCSPTGSTRRPGR